MENKSNLLFNILKSNKKTIRILDYLDKLRNKIKDDHIEWLFKAIIFLLEKDTNNFIIIDKYLLFLSDDKSKFLGEFYQLVNDIKINDIDNKILVDTFNFVKFLSKRNNTSYYIFINELLFSIRKLKVYDKKLVINIYYLFIRNIKESIERNNNFTKSYLEINESFEDLVDIINKYVD